MRTLRTFNFLSLNGFFKGPNEDISWHRHGVEEHQYARKGAQSESILLFGRRTYELMAAYWPSQLALDNDPDVAESMNNAEKIVFSNTLNHAEWKNTRIMSGNIVDQIRTLKQQPGKDMTILGSGSIVTLCTEQGIIDEYQLMIDPIALGYGVPLFQGLTKKIDLKLTASKAFTSGVIVLTYVPL
ncbi:MAG TPA: dihydrofolate reductase family protein [Bacteroidota bacterium]|nr:dihydrofolate reductase family protein [Bacteroidota bacterium]